MNLPDDGFIVAWDVKPVPRVKVGPFPDNRGWSDGFVNTTGCCDAAFKHMNLAERKQAMLTLAAHLIFDGISPRDVLREFAKLDLWREIGVLLPSGLYELAFLHGRYDYWNPHNP